MGTAEPVAFPGEADGQPTPRQLVLDLSRRWTGGRAADRSLIVCTTPRSGSWMLCTALASTRLAGYPNEYFLGEDEASWAQLWGVRPGTSQYLSAALRQGTSANGVFSAKLMASHLPAVTQCLDVTDADSALREAFPDPRVVWLRRADRTRQAQSLHRAVATGEWSIVAGGSRPAHPAVPEPVPEERAHVADWLEREDETWRRVFDRAGMTPHVVWYEELLAPAGLRACVTRLLELVSVRLSASIEVAALTARQSSDDPPTRIAGRER
jgi:LPS sulfotransferase NodH